MGLYWYHHPLSLTVKLTGETPKPSSRSKSDLIRGAGRVILQWQCIRKHTWAYHACMDWPEVPREPRYSRLRRNMSNWSIQTYVNRCTLAWPYHKTHAMSNLLVPYLLIGLFHVGLKVTESKRVWECYNQVLAHIFRHISCVLDCMWLEEKNVEWSRVKMIYTSKS